METRISKWGNSRAVRVPRIYANDGMVDPPKLMPKPTRHRATLEADTLGIGCMFAKQFSQAAFATHEVIALPKDPEFVLKNLVEVLTLADVA